MARQQWVLGIDGGGTKTTAILVARDGTLGAGETSGPSNLATMGVDHVARLLVDLVKKCCQKGSCVAQDLHAVGIGLAGAGRRADRAELRRQVIELSKNEGFPIHELVVESDWRIALEAAFAGGSGIVLIAGTGSIACAKAQDGSLHRTGGWGRVLGDEGSGFAIGRSGLGAVLRAYDGRGPLTMLSELALQHFSVSSIEELVGKIYREQADVATFVPKVFQAASKKDNVAQGILTHGAGELVDLVRVLMEKIQPKRKFPVALMGGLLEKDNVYSTMVKETITTTVSRVVVQKPQFPAVYGAAILAFRPFMHPAP